MEENNFTLSIIIPSFNEASTILQILDKIFRVELIGNFKREVIIVDDASSDNTGIIVKEYITQHSSYSIKYSKHTRNFGKGMAIRTGLKEVTGDFVIIQDADLECNPEDYNLLLPVLLDNNKVVYGSRFLHGEYVHSSWFFYRGVQIVSWFTNILYNQQLTDEPTCYKMFETSLLKSISLKCKGFEFCPEVTAKVAKKGYKIKEVPIHYYPRTKEEGKKIKWFDGIIAIWTLVKYKFVD